MSFIRYFGIKHEVTGFVVECELQKDRYDYYDVSYIFRAQDGEDYLGRYVTFFDSYKLGDKVNVEYRKSYPTVSRIIGVRTGSTPPELLLLLLIPGIGFVMIAGCFFKGLKRVKVLKNGVVTGASFKNMEYTGITRNKEKIYRYIYEFEDSGETYTVMLSDEQEIGLPTATAVIYDPLKPSVAVLWPEVSRYLQVTPVGDLQRTPFFAVWL